MQYKVLADNKLLWLSQMNATDTYQILEPKLTMELNRAGSFEFKLPPIHPFYNSLINIRTTIRIFENTTEIWRGRVLDQTDDTYKIRTVTCEGQLAYLNDFQAGAHSTFDKRTPSQMLDAIFAIYNPNAAEYRQIRKGNVVGFGNKTFTTPVNSSYHNLTDALFNELIGALGGFVRLRYPADGEDGTMFAPYLDYYATYSQQSGQVIEFGANILDYSHKKSGADVYTAITPVGGTVRNIYPIYSQKPGFYGPSGKYNGGKYPYASGARDFTTHNSAIDLEGHKELTLHFHGISTDKYYLIINYWKSSKIEDTKNLISSLATHSFGSPTTTGIDLRTQRIAVPDGCTHITVSFDNIYKGHFGLALGYAVTTWDGKSKLQIRILNNDYGDLNNTKNEKLYDDRAGGKSYYYSPTAVSKFGLITNAVNFDVDDDLNSLMRLAKATLDVAQQEIESFEISAVDLRALGQNTDRIDIGDLVRIVSRPHGIDTYYQCNKIEYDLDEPSNTRYALGIAESTLSGSAASTGSSGRRTSATVSGISSPDVIGSQIVDSVSANYATKWELEHLSELQGDAETKIKSLEDRVKALEDKTKNGVVTTAQYNALVARVKALEDKSK